MLAKGVPERRVMQFLKNTGDVRWHIHVWFSKKPYLTYCFFFTLVTQNIRRIDSEPTSEVVGAKGTITSITVERRL